MNERQKRCLHTKTPKVTRQTSTKTCNHMGFEFVVGKIRRGSEILSRIWKCAACQATIRAPHESKDERIVMNRKIESMEEVNRQYLEALKEQIEREDGVRICLDCKSWEATPEVIVLCRRHAKVR